MFIIQKAFIRIRASVLHVYMVIPFSLQNITLVKWSFGCIMVASYFL